MGIDIINENKPGYKKTTIGWIPEEWDFDKLIDIAPLQRGFDLPLSQIEDGNNPVVYSNGIVRTHSTFKVEGPGVVTGRSGTIGKVTYVEDNYWPHNTSLWVTDFKGNHPLYIYYLYLQIDLTRFKAGSGVPTLNRNDVHDYKFPLPPLDEQKKIAQILSTWDDTIAQEQKLLAQLKDRKKGLMQKLLTGELRLRDESGEKFSGEWEEVKLSDVASRISDKNKELNDNVVTISAQRGFVKQEDFFKKRVASDTLSGYYLIKKGQFAYNKSYSNGYPMGAFKRLDNLDKAVVTTLYICFELKENVDSDFMVNYFEGGLMIQNLMKIAQEGGRAHGLLNIALGDFFALKLSIPSLEEQQAIAKVLTIADKEIALQERRLSELQAQKKGLMQRLLTGQLRVKLN